MPYIYVNDASDFNNGDDIRMASTRETIRIGTPPTPDYIDTIRREMPDFLGSVKVATENTCFLFHAETPLEIQGVRLRQGDRVLYFATPGSYARPGIYEACIPLNGDPSCLQLRFSTLGTHGAVVTVEEGDWAHSSWWFDEERWVHALPAQAVDPLQELANVAFGPVNIQQLAAGEGITGGYKGDRLEVNPEYLLDPHNTKVKKRTRLDVDRHRQLLNKGKTSTGILTEAWNDPYAIEVEG